MILSSLTIVQAVFVRMWNCSAIGVTGDSELVRTESCWYGITVSWISKCCISMPTDGKAPCVEMGAGALPPLPANSGSPVRSEEHPSELQSLMRISYAVFCLKQKTQ